MLVFNSEGEVVDVNRERIKTMYESIMPKLDIMHERLLEECSKHNESYTRLSATEFLVNNVLHQVVTDGNELFINLRGAYARGY